MSFIDPTSSHFLSSAWAAIVNIAGAIGNAFGALGRFASNLPNALFSITHPINTVENSAAILSGLLTGNFVAAYNAYRRWLGYNTQTTVKPEQTWVRVQLRRIWADLSFLRRWVEQQIDYAEAFLQRWVWRLVARERRYRIEGDAAARAYAAAMAKAALATVQREAASGYQTGYSGQVSTAVTLLDDAVTRNPLLKSLVGKAVTGIIDLAGVENPVARFALGFALNDIVNKLGVDRAIGSFARDLLGPLLGQPHPKNLHDVIEAMTGRIGTVEGEWSQFMQDGGPQILQAGEQWRNITGLATDAALLAFAVAGVADPAGTARALSAIIRPVGTSTIEAITRTLAGR